MKQLCIILLFVLAGCAKGTLVSESEFDKGEVLLQLGDSTVKTVLFQSVAANGQLVFIDSATEFITIVRRVSPEAYVVSRKTFGKELWAYKLREYDVNKDNLITVEEFSAILDDTSFTEGDIELFIVDFKNYFK